MTRTFQNIPGFHNELPDCREAWPDGMQTYYCPKECGAECRNHCEDAHNQEQCRTKCEKDCMNDCLFVPCCTRQTTCDNGAQRVRESCRLDYWDGMRTSEWRTTGWC
ncbi:hypothetical protein ACFXB3_10345 [Streptomyces sp. NPDC059447]|uniref:hypothetical protein n=1 Tax=Streptomyces sp. NPDC059447 TaxID=3346834 RepID=UPI0036B70FFC